MTEIWKDVPGWETLYAVSDIGRVMSKRKEIILRPSHQLKRYPTVQLYRDGEAKAFSVHKLVMLAFVGIRQRSMTINHKDGNKLNNHLENLEYCTHQENINHAKKNGLYRNGIRNHLAKLDDEKVRAIREVYATGKWSFGKLAKLYDVSSDVIAKVVNRITWKHVD